MVDGRDVASRRKLRLKPLETQVIVVTGASSGIGLATARAAAARGARVVMAARNGAALELAARAMRKDGGAVTTVVADVSRRADVERIAAAALGAYGGFDTWVNNAGVGMFGRLDEVSDEDHRRVFDVNYWGVVYGCMVALPHLRRRGGAIVTVGSVLSDVSVPLQGPYCATKSAIRAFIDTLRQEVDHEGAPVSISLVKPSAIATPFPEHARNYMDREPTLPPPIYAPEDAARAILLAAEQGGRDLYVGGGGKLMVALNKTVPALLDWGAARLGPAAQKRGQGPARETGGNLYKPSTGGNVWGPTSYPVMRAGNPSSGAGGSGGRSLGLAAGLVLLAGTAAALLGRRA